MILPTHAAMHLGQFQVIRRKLGKPVLFNGTAPCKAADGIRGPT